MIAPFKSSRVASLVAGVACSGWCLLAAGLSCWVQCIPAPSFSGAALEAMLADRRDLQVAPLCSGSHLLNSIKNTTLLCS